MRLYPNNNVVSATFPGLAGRPVTFSASGMVPGRPEETIVSGIVLDNSDNPIPGATVSIKETTLQAITDDQGQFTISGPGVPVGTIIVRIDGATSTRPETFPFLEFELTTVSGQENTVGMPIRLPALDAESSQIVGGDEDVTLTMANVPGLSLTVFANSATFPDGSKTGRVTITQVHLDKIPMPPPNGSVFMPPAWTIQPAGVTFDPPARITIPNDGLAPGTIIDIFQFDHDLGEFVNVGAGTVVPDGSIIVSDPGFGISKTGWGGCGMPPPP
ncbi:MAG: carboxypeptidase-like regulatory domain-containing protein, partial [Dehalococcoidia bacterium]